MIIWKTKEVLVKDIKPTPNNYKIKTELGRSRLTNSLNKFGLASTVVVNTDLCLIDGNSRVEQAKERGIKKIEVSFPNRKLTSKEFSEMSRMYDFAKAGEVDLDRIKQDHGSAVKFYEEWGLEVPLQLLDKLGANTVVERAKGKDIVEKDVVEDVVFKVELFFDQKEEKLFRKLEEQHAKKLKTKSTTDTVLTLFKKFK
jgi:hypothetical protein